MTTALTTQNMDQERIELIKNTVAKGATDLEFELFLHACKHTGLDPLMKQIYAIKRWSQSEQREVMSFQTGIDGYRLIADRTGKYAGSSDAIFEEKDGKPILAQVTVLKNIDGEKCAFTASARWEEYVQRNRQMEPTSMWKKMPFLMLAKCAEALALRKAFPIELSGLYTNEEMEHLDSEWKPQIRTGQEMLAEMEAKEAQPSMTSGTRLEGSLDYTPKPAKGSVLEPPTEEILEDIEKAAALSMPTPGNPPSIYTFTDKLDNAESIKEWSDVMNEAQRFDWNAEQRTRLDDHAQRAKKRLTTKRVK